MHLPDLNLNRDPNRGARALGFLSLAIGLALVSPPSRVEAAYIEPVDRLIRDGLYKEAIAEIDKELTARPDDLDLALRKGICQSMLGCFDEAHKTLEGGLAIAPKEPRFLHNLGLLCMREKRFDEAESYFKRTIEARAWHPEANFHLGVICEGRGDLKQALEYYKRELNQNARCARAWQRWYALKGTAGSDSRVSVGTIAVAAIAAMAGLFVLYRKKKTDDEEIKCEN